MLDYLTLSVRLHKSRTHRLSPLFVGIVVPVKKIWEKEQFEYKKQDE